MEEKIVRKTGRSKPRTLFMKQTIELVESSCIGQLDREEWLAIEVIEPNFRIEKNIDTADTG